MMTKTNPFPPQPVDGPQGESIWHDQDGVHVEVRHLKVHPGPLLAILGVIETEGVGDRVIVHHHRDPLFLYPELADRGWHWKEVPGEPGEFRLLLLRQTTKGPV